MTTIATPADPRADFRMADMELSALVALIERPPLDDVLLAQDVALRAAKAIRTIISTSVCSFVVTGDIPEFAADDISHLEGLASYLDGVARDKARAGLPHSKALFAEIAKRIREYDVIRNAASACAASPDHVDILETIRNASDDWQMQGYPTALAEVRDMANVGRALVERIAENSSDGPLKGWMPADCPTEVVTDLLNMLADAPQPAAEAVEEMARAIFEADPDVGMTWAAFLALADREPDFLQNVEHVRRAARAAAAAYGAVV